MAASPKWPLAILGRRSPFDQAGVRIFTGFLRGDIGIADTRLAGQGNIHQGFQITRPNTAHLDDPGLHVQVPPAFPGSFPEHSWRRRLARRKLCPDKSPGFGYLPSAHSILIELPGVSRLKLFIIF